MRLPLLSAAVSHWRQRRAEVAIAHQADVVLRGAAIPTFRRSLPDLGHELARAQRYQRPLSIVILSVSNGHGPELAGNGSTGNSNGNGVGEHNLSFLSTRITSVIVGSILQGELRESDFLAYIAGLDRYLVFFTECTAAQAHLAIERLDRLFSEKVLGRVCAGVAEFPADGLTLSDLMSKAVAVWNERSRTMTAAELSAEDNK